MLKTQLLYMMKSAAVHGRELELQCLKMLYLNEIDLENRTSDGVKRVLIRIDQINRLRK